MSSISSRPRVSGVSLVLVRAALEGIRLAGETTAWALNSLSGAGRAAFDEATSIALRGGTVPILQPACTIQSDARLRQAEITHVLDRHCIVGAERTKLLTLATLAGSPYHLQNPEALHAPMLALQNAGTLRDAQRAGAVLLQAAGEEHTALLRESLRLACAGASMKVGFTKVEAMSAAGGLMRVVATDEAGRSLVSEIRCDRDREPSVETEVVGVFDRSCERLLDAFDEALEAEGVRASGPPQRKYTGGVVELDASREFVRRKVRRPAAQTASAGPDAGKRTDRVRQRLNRPVVQRRR